MQRVIGFLVASLIALTSVHAQAHEFPTKPVSLILPYPVGGPYDSMARMLAELLRVKLRQPVLVDAKPGGASLVATRYVQHAPPDGHTLLIQTSLLALNTLLFKDAKYSMEDFVPVTGIATNPYVLYVNETVPANNLKELLAYASANQDKLNIGDFGSQGIVQVLIDQLMGAGRMKITQIPYKGAADMTTALLANDIQIMFAAVGPGKPLVDAGKLKAIAIAQPHRSPLFPNVPTFAEEGMPSVNGNSFVAIFVRAGTPEQIVDRLRREILEAVKSEVYRDRVVPLGLEAWSAGPSELNDWIKSDLVLWAERIRAEETKSKEPR